MTTVDDLVAEVNNLLHSFTGNQEGLGTLQQPINASDTSLQVSALGQPTTGIAEIDWEMVYVASMSDGTMSIPSFGRGFRGTLATSHETGTMVVFDPLFPRKNIKDALIQSQAQIFPDVFAIRTQTLTYTPATSTYELPATASRVLEVTYDSIGPSGAWPRVRNWSFIPSSAEDTGKALQLGGGVPPGRSVRVLYAGSFTPIGDDNTATLDSLGHLESHRDLLVLGACWRLLQFMEPGRLNLGSAQAAANAAFTPTGSATAVARQVFALFQQRLAEEKARMRRLYPPTTRFSA